MTLPGFAPRLPGFPRFGIRSEREARTYLWVLASLGLYEALLSLLTLGCWLSDWKMKAVFATHDGEPAREYLRTIWEARVRPTRDWSNGGRRVAMALAEIPELLLALLTGGRLSAGWSWQCELEFVERAVDGMLRWWRYSSARRLIAAPRQIRSRHKARRAERRAPTMRSYWERVPEPVYAVFEHLVYDDRGEPRRPCTDNLRIGRLDDPEWMAAYERTRARGCCGFHDEDIVVDGVGYRMGFNFGH